MARDEAPPFARGETYFGGTVKDALYPDPDNYCGREYTFEPNSPNGYNQNDLSGRPIRVRVVKNTSGAALLPKLVVKHALAKPLLGLVDGVATGAVGELIAGIVDEFLPPAGVPNGDYFYVVVEGPSVATTVAASLTNLAVGDRIEVGTGGKVNKFAASPTATDELARIGRAEAAVTAVNTAVPVVVNVRHTY